MATKYTDLPAAGALTGDEVLAVVIPPFGTGDSRQTTTQDIADLGSGGGGASVNAQVIDTSTVAITLDFDSSAISILEGDTTIDNDDYVITNANETGAYFFDFILDIGSNFATTTIESSTWLMDDVRWDNVAKIFQPEFEGRYKFHGVQTGAGWLVSVNSGPFT